MKAGGGACIGSAGVDACSFLLPHHFFSKYSLYPQRKSLRKATSLETRNQKFFAQKEKEFKQKPEFLNFLEVTPGFEPGNQGFADPCLTTWLCHHYAV